MELEATIGDAVDNAIGEILRLVKTGDNGYLKRADLEHMLQEIRRNLKSDPGLYETLVLRPLKASGPRGPER
jgi:hypothetical protein